VTFFYLQIRIDNNEGPVIAEVIIPEGNAWGTIETPVSGLKPGVHNLILSLKDDKQVDVDWISFK
jgi:hypothetical protein